MGFSHSAAMNFVPLLARIVLAAAFIPAGYGKLFTQGEFTEAQAKQLNELGIATTPIVKTGASLGPQVHIRLASWESQAPAEADKPADPELIDESKVDAPQPAPAPATPPVVEGTKYTARNMHHITLLAEANGLPYPAYQGLLAGLTEFVGGILILVGFLSRLWGLGLAVVMVMAFYLTSLDMLLPNCLIFGDTNKFNQVFCQLGLFVLAFGVFLTGPGRLSLDRMLFGRSPPPQPLLVTQPPPSPRPM